MLILVDMDGVIADFDRSCLDIYRQRYPNEFYVPLEDRKKFYCSDEYPEELKDKIRKIPLSRGFISGLPIINGSLEALTELLMMKNDVYICTSPLLDSSYCAQEKYEWVNKHLGYEWTKRMILTKDKTMVSGDILIDDKPVIKGIRKPSWEHVLYTQPYNRHITSKRRLTWNDWKDVLFSGI